MKLSYNWLSDYVDLSGILPRKIAESLSLATCEIETFYQSFAYLDELQLARVLSVEKHPNADRLSLCRVESQNGELQIICGASNVRPNMLTALAPVGAKLAQKKEIKETSEENKKALGEIRKAKIRGVESFGMLCSAPELGLESITEKFEDTQQGILDLNRLSEDKNSLLNMDLEALKIGTPISQIFPFKDFIFDVDNKSITHRPDLWSHFGFARELSAIFDLPLRFDPFNLRPKKTDKSLPSKNIYIEQGAALAYYGLPLGGVHVKASPLWMQARLFNIGQTPINNVVDTSNYVMHDIGQPNHAFDARQLRNKTISVVLKNQNLKLESFTTLDGLEREIPKKSILILDGPSEKKRILALGGIMGALASRVRDDTVELFVESATFPRESIRRSIAALNLRTDSAQRFEKGQDPAQAAPALYRFAQLLKESCPDLKIGPLSGKMKAKVVKKNQIITDLGFIRSRLGFAIKASAVQKILKSLGFQTQLRETKSFSKSSYSTAKKSIDAKERSFKITVPSYRSQYDVSIAEDIVEEIGRLHGYDNIQAKAPSAYLKACVPNPKMQLLRQVREHFAYAMSFNESYNYSFSAAKHNQFWNKQALHLQNPVFDHKKELRLSLLPGLLEQAAANQDRFLELRLFEVGRVYWQEFKNGKKETVEESRLACVYMPRDLSPHKTQKDKASLAMLRPLLYMRQKVETLLHRLFASGFPAFHCIERPSAEDIVKETAFKDGIAGLHPRASLFFTSPALPKQEKILASLGLLDPSWEKHFGIKKPSLILDLNFDALYDSTRKKTKRDFTYQRPSVYPDSYFEISLLLPLDTGSHVPPELIKKMAIPEIGSVRYLAAYQGEPLAPDQKSVSYEITCRRFDRTLKSKELQNILDKVVACLEKEGFPLRA